MRLIRSAILGQIGFALLLSFSANSALGQRNQDVCRLTTHTRSISDGRGTGIHEISKFPVDDIETGTTKSFQYQWDNQLFVIDVEVDYGDMRDVEKGKPAWLILSLLARRIEDQNSKTILPIEAESRYRHKWGTVSLSKDVVFGDLIQNFKVMCSDGLSENGVRRGEPKWLKKSKKQVDN